MTQLVRGYTLALGIVAVVVALGALVSYSMASSPLVDPTLEWTRVLVARLELAIAIIIGLVTYLRARESRFAPGATAALNILFAPFFPFGTAAFLYWFISIRKREHALSAA